MINRGTALFLGAFIFVAIIVGKILWLLGTIFAFALIFLLLRALGKWLTVTTPATPIKVGKFEVVLAPSPIGFYDVLRQVERRLYGLGSVSDINHRFLMVTGLWDLAEPVPEILQHAILRKASYEQMRLINDPTVDKTFGVYLTPELVFRKLDKVEKEAFIHYCLSV